MANETFSLIIRTLGEFYVFLVVLRFLLQMAKADFYNPISQAVYKLTQPPVALVQKLMPRIAGRDFSALVVALLVKMLIFGLLLGLRGTVPEPISLLVVSLVGLLSNILDIYFYAVIASVIISWVAPNSYHPAPQLISQLCEPVFNLARKVVPPIGGLDLSPILIFLVIQVIQMQLHRII